MENEAESEVTFADRNYVSAWQLRLRCDDGHRIDARRDSIRVFYARQRCPEPFDQFDKAYWMTRDSALKEALDGWLTKSLKAGDYDKALAAAADEWF